jgi:single-strand DNA-binding protein
MGLRRSVGYVDVSVFGKPGEAAARILTKGWLVAAHGTLVYREWDTQDGRRRSAHRVVGNVDFLAAPRNRGTANGGGSAHVSETVPADEEIPF